MLILRVFRKRLKGYKVIINQGVKRKNLILASSRIVTTKLTLNTNLLERVYIRQ